jgi:hypothetical protein
MAFIEGKNGQVTIATNVLSEVTAFQYGEETDEIKVVAMQQDARYAGGTVQGSGSISCNFDPADTTGQAALIAKVNSSDQTVAVELQPGGDTSAEYELTGTVTVLSWDLQTDAEGIVSATFNFRGKLTLGLIP